jgi:hypothetical protein
MSTVWKWPDVGGGLLLFESVGLLLLPQLAKARAAVIARIMTDLAMFRSDIIIFIPPNPCFIFNYKTQVLC